MSSRLSTVGLLSFLLALHSPLPAAFATEGAGSGGGGNFTESDMKHFLNKLVPYLSSSEGLATFPEIAKYDQANPSETIEQIAQDLNPRLVNAKVYDAQGNERDCISVSTPTRYFECNANNLPALPDTNATDAVKSVYYGDMYRLVMHEVLVQAGLEDQMQKEIPSNYPISSRLNVHLEMFPEWMPGSKKDFVPEKIKLVCRVQGDGADYIVSKEGETLEPGTGTFISIEQPFKTKKKWILRAMWDFGDHRGGEIGAYANPNKLDVLIGTYDLLGKSITGIEEATHFLTRSGNQIQQQQMTALAEGESDGNYASAYKNHILVECGLTK